MPVCKERPQALPGHAHTSGHTAWEEGRRAQKVMQRAAVPARQVLVFSFVLFFSLVP